jgi:TRAP-type uncharacterized transport system substrate-binding protein
MNSMKTGFTRLIIAIMLLILNVGVAADTTIKIGSGSSTGEYINIAQSLCQNLGYYSHVSR